jgi:NADPH-dependent curcumin reductase CurA
MRGRLSGEASYTVPVPLGGVVGSATVGRVIASRVDAFAEGDWVAGAFGWQELGLSPGGRGIRRIPEGPIPPSAHIGVLGIPGLTAYFGLLDIGEPKVGETVLVSTAAGAVGSAAGQIARINGAFTVGIAGGPAKCRWLTEALGFDAAIDRLAEPDIAAAVARACPDGVDVFFDNVGNSLVDPILPLMKLHGRLVISGQTADYNLPAEARVGLKNTRTFITARLKMQGLVVFDYAREFPKAWAELTGWILDGRLKYREDIVDGLESLPAAFVGLFEGQNFGRKLARLVR